MCEPWVVLFHSRKCFLDILWITKNQIQLKTFVTVFFWKKQSLKSNLWMFSRRFNQSKFSSRFWVNKSKISLIFTHEGSFTLDAAEDAWAPLICRVAADSNCLLNENVFHCFLIAFLLSNWQCNALFLSWFDLLSPVINEQTTCWL